MLRKTEIHVANALRTFEYARGSRMLLRLPTVRAKLTALVSLSVVVMLAALPVLSWLLHRQLVDEVDDRVTDAEKAFQTELDDDLSDLTLASRILSADGATAHVPSAIATPPAPAQLAQVFVDVYPNIDVLLVESDGPRARAGRLRSSARRRAAPSPSWPRLAEGQGVQGRRRARVRVADVRCAAGVRHRRAPSPGVGGRRRLHAGRRGVPQELEREARPRARARRARSGDQPSSSAPTQEFPDGAVSVARRTDTTIVDVGQPLLGRPALRAAAARRVASAHVSMLAALDVTDIHTIVQRNLLYALAILAVAAVISVAFGIAPRVGHVGRAQARQHGR